MRNQLAYDIPTRFFHWLFAGLFIAATFITKVIDDESPLFSYHMLIGLTLSFVVILRILWGFIGTRYARFNSFRLSPGALIQYFSDVLTKKSQRNLGHNAASSWSTLTMMVLALALGITGYQMTSGGDKEAFEDIHELLANAFLIVAVLHVVGITVHTLKHKDAIGFSMIDGKKEAVIGEDPISSSRPMMGLIFLILTAGFAMNLIRNYDSQTQTLNLFGTTFQLGENESEEEEEGGAQENMGETGEDEEGDDD